MQLRLQLWNVSARMSARSWITPQGCSTVERHVRGKWVCRSCETLIQAPVPPHIIDKGIPTVALLVHVLIAKYLDHCPLYRQEGIFGARGACDTALDAGAMGRRLRCEVTAAGGCAEKLAADPSGTACR